MSVSRVLFAAVLLAAGCANQHLIEHYGSSYHAAFKVQAPDRPQGPARAAPGLDSQEASIIAGSYRQSLAPKEATAKEQPILMLAPPSADRPALPAPSVPKER